MMNVVGMHVHCTKYTDTYIENMYCTTVLVHVHIFLSC